MKKIHPATLAALLGLLALAGCGPKDVDPNAKIDAPGYYNGEMKPRGGNGGGPTTPTEAPKAKSGVGQDD